MQENSNNLQVFVQNYKKFISNDTISIVSTELYLWSMQYINQIDDNILEKYASTETKLGHTNRLEYYEYIYNHYKTLQSLSKIIGNKKCLLTMINNNCCVISAIGNMIMNMFNKNYIKWIYYYLYGILKVELYKIYLCNCAMRGIDDTLCKLFGENKNINAKKYGLYIEYLKYYNKKIKFANFINDVKKFANNSADFNELLKANLNVINIDHNKYLNIFKA